MKGLLYLFLSLLLLVTPTVATQFHVSNTASASGNGSSANPWTLQTALNHPSAVQPGDTIWLHGGTYVNPTNTQDKIAWGAKLNGTAAKPIIVRQYPNERVILDGANTQQNGIFNVSGNYTWYWGFEIMSSDTGRYDPGAGSYPDINYIKFGTGIDISSSGTPTGNKFINLIIHDTFIGIGSTNANDNSEFVGCLSYNNGWKATDRPHGHNIYIHNGLGKKKPFTDCITWGAFESNVQAWSGSDADMDDFFFDGHISFTPIDGYNFLLGASTYRNPTVTNGMFYHRTQTNWNLGYGSSGTAVGGNISNNYVGGGTEKLASFSGTTFNNNFVFYDAVEGSFPSGTGNTITSTRPIVNKIFVRKSLYETGRANIVVFNWSNASTVSVDLSSIYKVGDTYKIVDVQNPSVVILTGTYSAPISLPMTLTVVAQPIGNSGTSRTHTPTEFGCFIATGGSVPLPIQLTSFVVAHNGTQSVLTWITENEISNYGFVVQRQNGALYDSLGFVPAAGGTLVPHTYTFTDNASSQVAVYRLKQINLDATFTYYTPTLATSVGNPNTVPTGYKLEQNYPNPFNPMTVIRFGVGENTHVRLVITNMLGQEIKVLVDNNLNKGDHVVVFDASRFSTGSYIYRIVTENFSAAKVLTFVK